MGRPAGRRNADFAATRETLLDLVRDRLIGVGRADASFREMAAAAEVSVATLRHYFGDRDGLLQALMELHHVRGLEHLRHIATGAHGSLRDSVREALEYVRVGFARGRLGKVFVTGLATGMGHAALGQACLRELVEPTLQAVEARLQHHADAGQLQVADVRQAALMLFAPVLVALLHQEELGGAAYRPLDLGAFLDAQADSFVAAHGTEDEPTTPAIPVRPPAPKRQPRPPRASAGTPRVRRTRPREG
jgi:AcrR family transcriptional regulator